MTARTAFPWIWSATQIDTFLDCKRKWAWDKIVRVPRGESKGAQTGDACHKQQEKYLRGESYDFMQVVNGVKVADVCASTVHLLPDPRDVDPALIETSFTWTSPRGFTYTGRKDLELHDSGVLPGLAEENGYATDEAGRTGVPAIVDHKFLASLGYAKEKEELEWDVQANLYAYDLTTRTGSELADLAWVNGQTKNGRSAKRVHLRVHRDEAARKFALIEDVAADMHAIKARLQPILDRVFHNLALNSAPEFASFEGPPNRWPFIQEFLSGWVVEHVEANPGACDKYGGCSYRHICRLTPEEEAIAFMSGDSDLFDSLKKRAAKQDEDAGIAPAPAPAAQLPAWMTSDVDPMSLRKTPAPAQTPAAPVEEPPAINPPEADTPAPVLPPAPAVAPAPVAEAPAPKKRGRPKKNPPPDPIGADAAMFTDPPRGEQATEALHAGEPAPAAEEKCVAHGDAFEGCEETPAPALAFELYIDSFPMGEEFTPLEKYVARAQELVREHTAKTDEPVTDYRFIAFGKGPGALAIATIAALRENPPAKLVVRTGTDETRAVLSSLVPFASRIAQGF